MGPVRVAATVVVLAIVTVVMSPVQWLAIWRQWPLAARLPWYWQRVACYMAGIRVRVEGEPAHAPLIIAANHISWVDIAVLGSVLPVSFVAKQEVARWPILGMLARLQRSVFIDRTRRTQTGEATAEIASRVGRGDVIVLFAEGTTGDGNRVLPFRSALMGAARSVAADGGRICVQPVAISYSAIRGLPIGHADRPKIAWYGDMKLPRHFLHLVGFGDIEVVVRFARAIDFGPDADRKKVTAECFDVVRAMIDDIRRQPPLAPPRRRLFSRPPKEAKGTAMARAGTVETPREEITSRIT